MNNIRKERTKKCYIDATCDIIRQKGMSAATIRNISEQVGYNSATLYTYFENLPQLIFCAHMSFEDELLQRFKDEIEKEHVTEYYKIWPHIYVIMAQFYLENPNIFDCAFVSNYAGEVNDIMRARRANESMFYNYVNCSLKRIAQETNKDFMQIMQINQICLSQVVGSVLMKNKSRVDMQNKDLESFEGEIRRIIECFME